MRRAGAEAVRRSGRASIARVIALAFALLPHLVIAQAPGSAAPQASSQLRSIEGTVSRAVEGGLSPVRGITVTLHRIGSDTAGAVDSTVTRAGGRYAFRYHATGDPDAIYIIAAVYDGIAYFSTPTHAERVSGDDGNITVFDTTSRSVHLHVVGRHLIVTGPGPERRREVAEVYELSNDSSVTFVSADDETPVWSAHIIPGAADFRVGEGDIAEGAVRVDDAGVHVFAPISPGVRQLAFSYTLPEDSFPLSVPMERPIAVLEVLTEEPNAVVSGPELQREGSVATQGRTFMRYLAEDVPATAVVRVEVPSGPPGERKRYFAILGIVIALIMIGTLGVALRRTFVARASGAGAAAGSTMSESQLLVREIASMDAAFERAPQTDAAARADYEARRAELKARLADALAAERLAR